MQKYYLVVLLFFTSITSQAQDNFVGYWISSDGNLTIEIYTENKSYYGKVKSCKNQELKDKIVLIQMVKKSENRLYGGTYYDIKLRSEYEAKLKLIDTNKMQLKILAGLSSKTIVWYRQ